MRLLGEKPPTKTKLFIYLDIKSIPKEGCFFCSMLLRQLGKTKSNQNILKL